MSSYKEGRKVEWEWGQGKARGKVTQIFTSKITKTIKGNDVTRNASDDEPAYLIEQDDGDVVLKSHTEIEAVS